MATTDESGEATFSIEDNGTYQVWALGINGEGDTVLVKTKSKTVTVVDNVTVSFRMEGVINQDYQSGTVIKKMTLEVPDGSYPLCVIKRALDQAFEYITNTINPKLGFISNADIPGIDNPGILYVFCKRYYRLGTAESHRRRFPGIIYELYL